MGQLMIDLPPDLERRLEEEAERRGQAAEKVAQALLAERLQDISATSSAEDTTEPRPIWQKFVEAGRKLPDDVVNRLPPDGARNLDHYLYGAPKKP
jgi:hypothetical protein